MIRIDNWHEYHDWELLKSVLDSSSVVLVSLIIRQVVRSALIKLTDSITSYLESIWAIRDY